MLSVLIPIYNFDVRILVNELSVQAGNLSETIEILCIDDGSSREYRQHHRPLAALQNVSYIELENNIGRAAIRNLLAKKAKYDYLLFMDSDAKIISTHFLSNYFNLLPTPSVWMGGRVYAKSAPSNPDFYLHWLYGTKRESMPVKLRKKQPFHHFMTNNFLIPRSIFFDVPIDEEVKGYGHEDTLWGFSLQAAGYQIEHIDNPVLHLGLEPAAVFLNKSEEAVHNLFEIHQRGKKISSKLLSAYLILQKYHLTNIFNALVCPFLPFFERSLNSTHPNLRFFDLWKLCKMLTNSK